MKTALGVVIFMAGIGFGVAFTWLHAWTPGLTWIFGGLLAFGAYLLDSSDFVAFLKNLPTRFGVPSA